MNDISADEPKLKPFLMYRGEDMLEHPERYMAQRDLQLKLDEWILANPLVKKHKEFQALSEELAPFVSRKYYRDRRYELRKGGRLHDGEIEAELERVDDFICHEGHTGRGEPCNDGECSEEETRNTRLTRWGQETPPPTVHSFDAKTSSPEMERHIVLSDLHYREYNERLYDVATNAYFVRKRAVHDARALAAAELFMREWKPTHIWLNGDLLDFPQLSRFDKEDYDSEGLEQDILGLRVILKRIRRNHPDAQMHYLLGNHEERLERYMRANAPALRWLTSLTFHAIFEAKELGMTIYPYRERVPILPGVLEVTHGDKIAQKSGYTAQRMLEAGISGVSGHIHRLGMVFKTTRTGMTLWAEGGCLCSLEPGYVNSPNWQTGFTTIYVDRPNKRFHMDIVPIINGRIVFAGEVYEVA